MSNKTQSASSSSLQVNCPTCKTKVEWNESAPFRPFCSERCQQIDLGAWSSEEYSIAAEPTEEWSVDNSTLNTDSTSHTLQ